MRKGFTILELLVATALTALLMLAVLRVVGTLGASRAALARLKDADPLRREWIDIVRRDLAHASAAAFTAHGVTLTSHLSLDASTAAARHEPVTVTYAVVLIGNRRWLVRRQTSRIASADPSPGVDLLCPDVAAFSLRPAGVASTVDVAASASTGPVPAQVTLRLDRADGHRLEETVVIR